MLRELMDMLPIAVGRLQVPDHVRRPNNDPHLESERPDVLREPKLKLARHDRCTAPLCWDPPYAQGCDLS